MKNRIKPGIGVFVKDQKDVDFVKECIEGYNFYVQLGFYKKDHVELGDGLIGDYEDNITSIHLPNGLGALDFRSGGMVEYLKQMFNVDLFVVHPWSDELDEIVDVMSSKDYTLCLENFPVKRRKRNYMGDPVALVAKYGQFLQEDWLGLCMDFSHMDTPIANYTYLRSFVPYTKMLHVSSRVGKAQHIPMFKKTDEINPMRLLANVLTIPDLPIKEIILEYMPVYRKNLIKDSFWLIQYMRQKRKKFGDVS